MPRKIILTGATGLIGKYLYKELKLRGDEVTIFARNLDLATRLLPGAKEYFQFDFSKPENWERNICDKDVIIHLAGAAIGGRRWSKKIKKEIIESRISSTKALVEAIGKTDKKPNTFICASAIGYYGTSETEIFTEESPPGNDFLAGVCKQWEDESAIVENYGVRRVSIRTGVVLEKNEGALAKMLLPYKFFVGGPLGKGNQWLSWIHIIDIVNIYLLCIDNDKISGAINATAPNPVRMKEFAKTLGRVLKRPAFFNVPEFILKLIFGESALTVIKGQKVLPSKILNASYNFRFPKLKEALLNLFSK
jgi:uncharacterized protein (TIGR01777 family)